MTPTKKITLDERIAEVQKVADRYGQTVHIYEGFLAFTREQPGLKLICSVPPLDGSVTGAVDHGLGENTAHEYATPQGDGRKL